MKSLKLKMFTPVGISGSFIDSAKVFCDEEETTKSVDT
jgi:hypothetical protein